MKFSLKFLSFILVTVVLSSLAGGLSVKASEQKEVMSYLGSKGWIDSSKSISSKITRSEAATLLGKSLGIIPRNEKIFQDVNINDESYKYLPGLVEKGIFSKTDKFNPNEGLTRGQAAKILVQAYQLTGTSTKQFNDVPSTIWEYPYVQTLIYNDITIGTTLTTFYPKQQLIKKHFYTFIYRLEMKKPVETVEIVSIKDANDLEKLLNKIYVDLPKKIELKTTMKYKEVRDLTYEWEMKTHPKEILNKSTLANYTVEKKGAKIFLIDNSNDEKSAKQIEKDLKKFAQEWANENSHLSDEMKLKSVYDFIYENYTYSAKGYKEMLVGNMWNDTLACNGFSRLAYEMLNALGLETQVILGESHLWNSVKINEEIILFDVTSDIFLSKKYLTLGVSSGEHKQLLQSINLWSGDFDSSKYYNLTESATINFE